MNPAPLIGCPKIVFFIVVLTFFRLLSASPKRLSCSKKTKAKKMVRVFSLGLLQPNCRLRVTSVCKRLDAGAENNCNHSLLLNTRYSRSFAPCLNRRAYAREKSTIAAKPLRHPSKFCLLNYFSLLQRTQRSIQEPKQNPW